MNHNIGELYSCEYPWISEDEKLILVGKVVYADKSVFVVLAENPTNMEIADTYGIDINQCKEYLLDFEYNQTDLPVWALFVPMSQEDEQFLFYDCEPNV